MKKWPLNRARVRLKELVRKAQEEGVQIVTVDGKDAVVVLSKEEYERLQENNGTGKVRPGLYLFLELRHPGLALCARRRYPKCCYGILRQ